MMIMMVVVIIKVRAIIQLYEYLLSLYYVPGSVLGTMILNTGLYREDFI